MDEKQLYGNNDSMTVEELKQRFENALKECPIIAILRGITPEEVEKVCCFFAETGIKLLEIPLNTPRALECIAIAAKSIAPGQIVGAGTVLTPKNVRDVRKAGGKFIISPNTDTVVIQETKSCGLLSMPGCFTVSEAFVAQSAGADFLKLFPVGSIGAGYIKDIKAVVKAPFIAVGGVTLSNMPDFLKCCNGVGIGSALYKPGKCWDDFCRDTENFVKAARNR